MKIKQFTHTDLDGVGSAIIMRNLFPQLGGHTVDVTYCDYEKIDKKVLNFTKSDDFESYDYIFITDISVTEETALVLDEVHNSDNGPFVQLLDHHGTAEWLNKYEWAHVEQTLYGYPAHKSSGTSLIIDFFKRQRPGFGVKISDAIFDFAETVRRYDTWEWSTIYGEVLPKELNDYLYMIGREAFAEYILNDMPFNRDGTPAYFNKEARALLDQKQKEIEAYIKKKNKQLLKVYYEDVLVGVVFADQHTSELGNEICKHNEDIAFIAIIDMNDRKISFRTVRDDVSVAEIAKKYGGGGHPKAAGAQFDEEKVTDFLSKLF